MIHVDNFIYSKRELLLIKSISNKNRYAFVTLKKHAMPQMIYLFMWKDIYVIIHC